MQDWVSACAFGFPSLLFSCQRCKMIKLLLLCLELSSNVLESRTSLSLPPSLPPSLSSHLWKGRRKWNSLITNPSLWTKRICINPGAIESLHLTTTSLPFQNLDTLNSILRSSHDHYRFLFQPHHLYLSLFLSPRIPCRLVWLGTSLLTWCAPHYYHWADVDTECILMIIVSVINKKIDNLTGWSHM